MTFRLFFLLFVAQFALHAQEKMVFSTGYLPNKIYEQTNTQIIQMELLFTGDEEVIAYIEESQSNPMVTEERSNIVSTIITGAEGEDGFFPFSMELVGMNNEFLPDGAKVHGKLMFPSLFNFDSVSGVNFDKEMEGMFLEGLSDIIEQFPFPNRALAVGDTFSESTPVVIPLGGTPIEMEILTLYELKEIDGDQAVFDIKQDLQASMEMEDVDAGFIKLKGNGEGDMIYDVANKFILSTKMHFDMEFDFDVKDSDVKVEVKQTMRITNICKITDN